jgi:predicted anti-sigma-YlaC factor YlaD
MTSQDKRVTMLGPIPPATCETARKAVSLQLDGELSEVGSARLETHLRECEACAAYALELAAIATRLRSAPLEDPAFPAFQVSRRRARPARIATVAAAAAAVAAGLATGVGVLGTGRTTTSPPATVSASTLRLPPGALNFRQFGSFAVGEVEASGHGRPIQV